jgi:hypothetical protein
MPKLLLFLKTTKTTPQKEVKELHITHKDSSSLEIHKL